jgi:hypothetical protein
MIEFVLRQASVESGAVYKRLPRRPWRSQDPGRATLNRARFSGLADLLRQLAEHGIGFRKVSEDLNSCPVCQRPGQE